MEYKKQERQRLTKTVNGTTLSYVYDGLDLLYAKEGDTVTEKNIIEDDGSMILSCRGTVPYWYRQDIRGSVTFIIDGTITVSREEAMRMLENVGVMHMVYAGIPFEKASVLFKE